MMTLSRMVVKTNWMMNMIRERYLNELLSKYREACKNYYTQGYDNGEVVKLYKELETEGVDTDLLFDIDWEERERAEEVAS